MSTALKGSKALAILEAIVKAFNEENKTNYEGRSWSFLDELCGENIPQTFTPIEQEGGEGEGDYAYKVFEWNSQLYKLTYGYQSYAGYDYDYAGLYEVTEQQKTITVYE